MNKKEFPTRGYCFTDNKILLNYIKKTRSQGYSENPIKKGIAWNQNMWWYIAKKSHNPEYSAEDLLKILNINIEISEVKNLPATGTLFISSGTIQNNTICVTTTTTDPFDNPSTIATKSLITEPIKLRIKCQNLKKNLKVSLMQINLK